MDEKQYLIYMEKRRTIKRRRRGEAIGFLLFLMSLGLVWLISRIGVWDVAKLAGIASLVLGLAAMLITGCGSLAVKLGSKLDQRMDIHD